MRLVKSGALEIVSLRLPSARIPILNDCEKSIHALDSGVRIHLAPGAQPGQSAAIQVLGSRSFALYHGAFPPIQTSASS